MFAIFTETNEQGKGDECERGKKGKKKIKKKHKIQIKKKKKKNAADSQKKDNRRRTRLHFSVPLTDSDTMVQTRGATTAAIASAGAEAAAGELSALVPAGSFQPYRHLRTLALEVADLVVKGGGCDDEDEEVRRLLGAFPVVFPSLKMIHVHRCGITRTAERVLEGLADVYAVGLCWCARRRQRLLPPLPPPAR